MAKRFQFEDDEEEYEELESDSQDSKETNPILIQEYFNEEKDDDLKMSKKKKKFIWKWWHFAFIGFIALGIAFLVYIFVLSSNDGPVYGNSRCQGIVEINQSYINSTITEMKKENSSIQNLDIEIACKQLKVDIVFKDKMKTKQAEEIAEKVVQSLDKKVGLSKDKDKTYSQLFGYKNKIAQYEVNLFLESKDSKDFPIYGTKHVSKDNFSYTLASVKDKDSKDKAEATLKK